MGHKLGSFVGGFGESFAEGLDSAIKRKAKRKQARAASLDKAGDTLAKVLNLDVSDTEASFQADIFLRQVGAKKENVNALKRILLESRGKDQRALKERLTGAFDAFTGSNKEQMEPFLSPFLEGEITFGNLKTANTKITEKKNQVEQTKARREANRVAEALNRPGQVLGDLLATARARLDSFSNDPDVASDGPGITAARERVETLEKRQEARRIKVSDNLNIRNNDIADVLEREGFPDRVTKAFRNQARDEALIDKGKDTRGANLKLFDAAVEPGQTEDRQKANIVIFNDKTDNKERSYKLGFVATGEPARMIDDESRTEASEQARVMLNASISIRNRTQRIISLIDSNPNLFGPAGMVSIWSQKLIGGLRQLSTLVGGGEIVDYIETSINDIIEDDRVNPGDNSLIAMIRNRDLPTIRAMELIMARELTIATIGNRRFSNKQFAISLEIINLRGFEDAKALRNRMVFLGNYAGQLMIQNQGAAMENLESIDPTPAERRKRKTDEELFPELFPKAPAAVPAAPPARGRGPSRGRFIPRRTR